MTDRPSQREVSERFKVERIEEARAARENVARSRGPGRKPRDPRANGPRGPQARPLDDGRTGLLFESENLQAACDEVAHVLGSTPNVFERGGALVRVAGEQLPDVLDRYAANDGARDALRREPRVIKFTPATLRALLSTVLVVGKMRENPETGDWVWVPGRAPDDLIKATLEAGAWPGKIPTLAGISETAFLRPDGSLATAPGFDASTGYYLAAGSTFLAVPDAPTQAEAATALRELEEVFADFPHVSQAHRMVPIAAILTLLARPAIRGSVPAFLFDASTRGSGKSLQTDAVAIVGTGRASSKMSWPPDEIELEKVLAAYALRGAGLVNFDNVASGFGGAPLDKCLTAIDSVELRVLGKSEVPKLPWGAVIMASGNNLVILGDTTRRALVSRVESPLENPEERTDFRHPDLLAWVTENRARLVRAALTILRGFVVAGRPSQGLRAWGSFEAWAALVPNALVWAGGADLMACRPEVSGNVEPEKAALLAVLEYWPRLAGDGGTTAKRALEALYPAERMRGPVPPDGFEDLREALESVTNAKQGTPPSAVSLGKFLQRVCGRVAPGGRLARRNDRKGLAFWIVERAS